MWHKKAKQMVLDKGVMQKELLSVFNVKTVGAVSHYLNGVRDPSPQQLKNLADILGVKIDDFFIEEQSERSSLPEALVQAIRSQPVKPLGHRYDWSNPGGLRPEVMIYKVLKAERFEDVLEVTYQYGFDKVKEIFESAPELKERKSLSRSLNNIKYGMELAHAEKR